MNTPRELEGKQREIVQRNVEALSDLQEKVQSVRHTLNEVSELVCGEDEAIDFAEMEVVSEEELEMRLQARQSGIPREQLEDYRKEQQGAE